MTALAHAIPTPMRRRFRPATPRRSFGALRLVSHAEHQQRPSLEWVPCPQCGKNFLGGSIVDDEPVYMRPYGTHVVMRRGFCDHCDIVFGFGVASNASGTRLGDRVTEPFILRNPADIERFLNAHPEATGILQR